MREILFRGKRLDNGEWVYGSYYVDLNGDDYIVPINWTLVCDSEIEVLHETVGQFTGLLDKNGNKIFEGDIVTDGNIHYDIYFDEEDMCFMGYNPKHSAWVGIKHLTLHKDNEVIGNIHDNKELVK